MWEKLILATIATFCLYLFVQLGGNSAPPGFLQKNLSQTPNLMFNIPIFAR